MMIHITEEEAMEADGDNNDFDIQYEHWLDDQISYFNDDDGDED